MSKTVMKPAEQWATEQGVSAHVAKQIQADALLHALAVTDAFLFGAMSKAPLTDAQSSLAQEVAWLLNMCPTPLPNLDVQPLKAMPKLVLRIRRDDEIPAFGGWCSCKDPTCDLHNTILLNVEGHFGELEEADGTPVEMSNADRKQAMIQTLMHEFGHALEQYFGLPANEEMLEAVLDKFMKRREAEAK